MPELPSKVTHDAYWTFLRHYHEGQYPHLRLGQAFMCHMISWKGPHTELFYTNDESFAKGLIESNYVEPLTS